MKDLEEGGEGSGVGERALRVEERAVLSTQAGVHRGLVLGKAGQVRTEEEKKVVNIVEIVIAHLIVLMANRAKGLFTAACSTSQTVRSLEQHCAQNFGQFFPLTREELPMDWLNHSFHSNTAVDEIMIRNFDLLYSSTVHH